MYGVVRDHFESFRVHASRWGDGEGLPAFVEREFRAYVRCGVLAGGFARFRCAGCGEDRLVAFSCKGRGFCPGCGGRRMAERAAHLVDRVLPDVPVRQWVLTLPFRLRYRLAWDHGLCRVVAGIFARAVMTALRHRAASRGIEGGRSGVVMVIQRFGGALNLNVHLHALVLDGVFARDPAGRLAFHRIPLASMLDVAEVLAAIEPRTARLLTRRDGGAAGGEDGWAAEAPALAELAAASVQGMRGAGNGAGRHAESIDDAIASGRGLARGNGYSLHAGVVVPVGARRRLEQLCRYVLRPPVSSERLRVAADGRIVVALRHRWGDGTSEVALDPVTFLGRLAVLIPRPRVNLLMYHGVLGARATWRAEVVRQAVPAEESSGDHCDEDTGVRGLRWAALMRRTFAFDVLACPRCGGRLRLIALIEETTVVTRILRHLGFPSDLPALAPARSPPGPQLGPNLEW